MATYMLNRVCLLCTYTCGWMPEFRCLPTIVLLCKQFQDIFKVGTYNEASGCRLKLYFQWCSGRSVLCNKLCSWLYISLDRNIGLIEWNVCVLWIFETVELVIAYRITIVLTNPFWWINTNNIVKLIILSRIFYIQLK